MQATRLPRFHSGLHSGLTATLFRAATPSIVNRRSCTLPLALAAAALFASPAAFAQSLGHPPVSLSGRMLASASSSADPAADPAADPLIVVPIPIESKAPELTANPGRPSLSTSALLTPVGYLQFESGMLYGQDSGEFSYRSAEEQTVRYTVTSRLQFIAGVEPVVYSIQGEQLTQRGNTIGGVQVVLKPGEGWKPTVSAGYLRLLLTGSADDMDIGGFTNSVLLMASNDMGKFHMDANLFSSETKGTVRRAQVGEAVAITHPVTPRLSATGELREFSQPLTGGRAFDVMGAGVYTMRPNLVVDLGLTHGFTGTSTRWQLVSGVTYVLPRKLWGFSRLSIPH